MKILVDIIVLFALVAYGMIISFVVMKERGDRKRWSPEGEDIKDSRKKRTPLAIVAEGSRNLDIFTPILKDGLYHLVNKKHNYGTVFDPEADAEAMYHSKDLKIFFAFKDHAEIITPQQAAAIETLAELKPEGINEARWWELLRMNEDELKQNKVLLNIESDDEIETLMKWKKQAIEKTPIKNGVFAYDTAMKVINPAHSSGHLLNLQSAWFKKGSFGNIDTTKLLWLGAIAFSAFLVLIGAGICYQMIN